MERRDFTYSQYSVQFYMKVKDRIWKKKKNHAFQMGPIYLTKGYRILAHTVRPLLIGYDSFPNPVK